MDVKLSYSLSALHMAAKFVWENNPHIGMWPSQPKDVLDVIDLISSTLRKTASVNAENVRQARLTDSPDKFSWTGSVTTGGYMLLYSLDESDTDDISIEIEIMVDPAIGTLKSSHIIEFLDDIDADY